MELKEPRDVLAVSSKLDRALVKCFGQIGVCVPNA